jgi:hypothetical protein
LPRDKPHFSCSAGSQARTHAPLNHPHHQYRCPAHQQPSCQDQWTKFRTTTNRQRMTETNHQSPVKRRHQFCRHDCKDHCKPSAVHFPTRIVMIFFLSPPFYLPSSWASRRCPHRTPSPRRRRRLRHVVSESLSSSDTSSESLSSSGERVVRAAGVDEDMSLDDDLALLSAEDPATGRRTWSGELSIVRTPTRARPGGGA